MRRADAVTHNGGPVAVYVALGGGPVRGGAQDAKRSCLTGRGYSPLVREEAGGQRSLWPPERLGPRRRVVALPIPPGFARLERHHVRCNLSSSTWETMSPITMVPPPVPAAPEPVAALMLRVTGVDIP